MNTLRCLVMILSFMAGQTNTVLAQSNSNKSSTTTKYRVALPAPQTQMVEMSVQIDAVDQPTIDFCLPIWRPGRYVVLDPASTIREVQAVDDHDRALDVEKTDKSTWRVAAAGAHSITLKYKVYANSLGDRTRHVDDSHAFLSPATVFMYVPRRRDQPLTVTIDAPKDWKIATGLDLVKNTTNVLAAPNYDVLVDSPLEIGIHETIDFEAVGKPHQIVLWGNYPRDYDAAQLKADFGKIINKAWEIFGRLPYERYVFIVHLGAGAGGGTEHLNSTIMQTSRASLDDPEAYKRFLGLVSHEFFHTWNVKQFRPEGIHPYDYQHENYSKLLWVCEGTTSYYTPLLLVRAGLKTPDDFLDDLATNIDGIRRRPAETTQSLEESSFDAWLHFNKSSPDDVNSSVSFYSKGAMVSLLLDMDIRRRTENKGSLDLVMRGLFDQFPLAGRGYSTNDLIGVVNGIAEADYSEFFEAYVRGAEPLPFESALKTAGLELFVRPAERHNGDATTTNPDEIPQAAYLGLNLTGNIVSSALADGPAYAAGLISGDEIIAIDGRRLSGGAGADLDARLKKCKPGQSIAVLYCRREDMRTANITLAGRPDGKWSIRRMKYATAQQKETYRLWLGQAWPEQ